MCSGTLATLSTCSSKILLHSCRDFLKYVKSKQVKERLFWHLGWSMLLSLISMAWREKFYLVKQTTVHDNYDIFWILDGPNKDQWYIYYSNWGALTTNKSFIADYNVNILAVANHCLVAVTLKLKAPKPWPSYIFTRSYKNHNPVSFLRNLECVPFYIVNIFNNFDDQVDVINKLFLDTLNEHAQIKCIQIK